MNSYETVFINYLWPLTRTIHLTETIEEEEKVPPLSVAFMNILQF